MNLLQQLVPLANANYEYIVDVLREPGQFNPEGGTFVFATKTMSQLIENVNNLFLLIKESSSFSFTTRRLCKIGGDFNFRTTLLSSVTDLLNLMNAVWARPPVEEFSTLQDIVNALMPSAKFKEQLLNTCTSFLLLDNLFSSRLEFLELLHNLFSVLTRNCLSLGEALEMCKISHVQVPIDPANLKQITNGIADAIVYGQQLCGQNIKENLDTAIENRQRSPIFIKDGARLAIIPGMNDELFVEKDGTFYYPQNVLELDTETMLPKDNHVWIEMIVYDGIVTSPERFKGAPGPVIANVPFLSLYHVVNHHIQESYKMITAVQKGFRQTEVQLLVP
ncbi:MAG: hypothetical protein LBJ89_00850 [Holosporales bacterium]|jgi:hypothetical protein|nr:hypothetical protein [Holosporales bacterium]